MLKNKNIVKYGLYVKIELYHQSIEIKPQICNKWNDENIASQINKT